MESARAEDGAGIAGSASGSEDGFDLGVLFVHGVGSQKQGQTLTQWGDAIAKWVSNWQRVDRDDEDEPAVLTRVYLRPASGPAYGTLHLKDADGSMDWLFAEAWWAGDIAMPKFGAVTSWSLRATPVTLFSHLIRSIRHGTERLRGTTFPGNLLVLLRLALWVLIGTPVFLLLAPLLVVLLALLLLIGLVPIPQIRSFVVRAQGMVSGTVGDSLILLDSPVQRSAMTERVVAGIRFLRANRCAKVVVVAHSQGAALAHMAARELPPTERIDTLITVGSGVAKLHEIRRALSTGWAATWVPSGLLGAAAWLAVLIRDGGRDVVIGAVLPVGAIAITVLAYFAVLYGTALMAAFGGWKTVIVGWALALVGIGFGAVQIAGWSGWSATVVLATLLSAFLLLATGGAFRAVGRQVGIPVDDLCATVDRWVDIYAQNDPVPGGQTTTGTIGRPVDAPINNLDSTLRDHNAYVSNVDACVSRISRELVDLSAGPLDISAFQSAILRDGVLHRRWRVKWRVVSRWLVVAAAAIFLVRVGRQRAVGANTAFEWIRSRLPLGLEDTLPTMISRGTQEAAAVIGVATIAALVFGIMSLAWAAWTKADAARLFGGEAPEGLDSPYVRVFLAMWGLALFAAVSGEEWLSDLTASGRSEWARIRTVLFVAGIVALWVIAAKWALRRFRAYQRITGIDHPDTSDFARAVAELAVRPSEDAQQEVDRMVGEVGLAGPVRLILEGQRDLAVLSQGLATSSQLGIEQTIATIEWLERPDPGAADMASDAEASPVVDAPAEQPAGGG